MDWLHECMDNRGEEVIFDPFEVGDAQRECTEAGELSPEKVINFSSC